MTDDEKIAAAVSAKLTSQEFYVGQRVRIKRRFGSPRAGMETTIVKLPCYNDDWVKLDPPISGDGLWAIDWIEPIPVDDGSAV